jgi:hypothetical protein
LSVEAEVYCPPGAPLPNIAHDRGHGITSIRVYCEGLYCPHWRVFTFDELGVPDDLPVIRQGCQEFEVGQGLAHFKLVAFVSN